MPAIYHPGVIQIVPHYNIGSGRDAVNVLYFQTAGVGLTTAALTTVQGAFDTAWATFWKPRASGTVSYIGSWVTDMSSNTGNQVTNSGFTPVVGTNASSELGDNASILLSLKTQTRYRGGHGRIYLAGSGSNNVNNDGRTIIASVITSMNTAWSTFLNAMSAISGAAGGPYNLIVWHKKLASNPNTVELVNAMIVSNILATQRRRLRKVSRHRAG